MKPTNETENLLLHIISDANVSQLAVEQQISLITYIAYPDPNNDYAAGKCYGACIPPSARETFVEYIIKKLKKEICEHDDKAIEVAEYILSEIQKNSNSKVVENLSIMNRVGAYPAALNLWIQWVNTDAPWDHKPIIRRIFNLQGTHRPVDFMAIKASISKSHYFKYKHHDYYYDVFSNIHYGYVGLKAGFSQKSLLLGSNTQQFFNDLNPFGEGDSQSDKISIEIGFQLYEKTNSNPNLLTAQDILNSLEGAKFKLNIESKQTHWCWHPKNPNPKIPRMDNGK